MDTGCWLFSSPSDQPHRAVCLIGSCALPWVERGPKKGWEAALPQGSSVADLTQRRSLRPWTCLQGSLLQPGLSSAACSKHLQGGRLPLTCQLSARLLWSAAARWYTQDLCLVPRRNPRPDLQRLCTDGTSPRTDLPAVAAVADVPAARAAPPCYLVHLHKPCRQALLARSYIPSGTHT